MGVIGAQASGRGWFCYDAGASQPRRRMSFKLQHGWAENARESAVLRKLSMSRRLQLGCDQHVSACWSTASCPNALRLSLRSGRAAPCDTRPVPFRLMDFAVREQANWPTWSWRQVDGGWHSVIGLQAGRQGQLGRDSVAFVAAIGLDAHQPCEWLLGVLFVATGRIEGVISQSTN